MGGNAANAARRKEDESRYLRPLKTKLKRYRTVVYDLESKDGMTQEMGFTRPFLAWVYDGHHHQHFRQPGHLAFRDWRDAPWLDEGGLIDAMMRYLLGLDLCGICEVQNQRALENPEVHFKLCRDCKFKRERYQAKHARIYAHNAGRFDALFIMPWLLRPANVERFEFEISGPESRIQRLEIWPRGRDRKRLSWVFLDSVSILPMSLKAAGETFCGVKDRKIEFDLQLPENDISWEAYNRRDCEVLYTAIEGFNVRVIALGGEVGITVPSTAMSLFRRVFLKKPIHRNKHFSGCRGQKVDERGVALFDEEEDLPLVCHGCAHDFVRRGYYGGRTELFMEHGIDVRYFDINSSYPFSMKMMMPTGTMIEFGSVQDPAVYENLRRKRIGFVEVDVAIPKFEVICKACKVPMVPERIVENENGLGVDERTDEDRAIEEAALAAGGMYVRPEHCEYRCSICNGKDGEEQGCKFPPLPHRYSDKLVFPTGRFRGVWDYDELELLKHPRVNGKITHYHKSVWYEQRPIFEEMIDNLYGLRQAAKESKDKALDVLMKLLMNACYGKFGMRIERGNLVVHRIGDPEPLNGRPISDPNESGVWEVPTIVDAPYVIPQIAAKVTSNSRILLFHGMMSVLDQGAVRVMADNDDGTKASPVVGKIQVLRLSGACVPYEAKDAREEGSVVVVRSSKDNEIVKQFRWEEIAEIAPGEIVYVDTDSIMCMNAIVVPEGKKLGEWKREYPHVLLDGTFILPKLYQLRKHGPECSDHVNCPGCRWTLTVNDLETDQEMETYIDRFAHEVDEAFLSIKRASAGNLKVTLEEPSIEKMKGVPFKMQNAKQFKRMAPVSKGGQGERVYVDNSMITQHRVMLREGLKGPRVYRGIPGDPSRYKELGLEQIEDDELRAEAIRAMDAGSPVLVGRIAARVDRAGYADVASRMCEAEKYRARFKAVRTTYDKRTLLPGGTTVPLHLDEIGSLSEVAKAS